MAAAEAISIGWQGIVVIISLAISLVIMGFDWIGPDFVFAALGTLYTLCGILSMREAAAGFANTGVLTVMALFVVAEGVSQTGGLDRAMSFVLGRANSVFFAQVRMMIPVMFASAFLNNTPIVALGIPIIISWCKRCGVPVKKMLIPLSQATVFGGTCTLIGTSTNLVVSGLQEQYFKGKPEFQFGFWDITPYGVPYAIWGMAYILLFSKWLLPGEDSETGRSDMISGLYVPEESYLVGKLARTSDLCKDGKAKLTAVAAKGHPAHPAPYDYIIQAGDTLYVTGPVRVVDALARQLQLVLVTDETDYGSSGAADPVTHKEHMHAATTDLEADFGAAAASDATGLVQVTLKKTSELVGKGIREAGFRGRFSAAVIAVKRSKQLQHGRLGDLVLQPKDVLVLSTAPDFNPGSSDFTANFDKLKYLDEALAKEFTLTMTVPPNSSIAGQSIQRAGLRGVNGLYLYEIVRSNGLRLPAVSPDTELQVGDTLYFTGDMDGLNFLLKFTGLQHKHAAQVAALEEDIIHRRLVQAVVSAHGPLVYKTLQQVNFRATYGAAVVAIHRSGHVLNSDLASTPLHAGDILVLETGPSFLSSFNNNKAFSLIREVPNSSPQKASKMWVSLLLTAAMVATQIVGAALDREVVHLWPAAVATAGLMLAFKCMSGEQARAALDWDIYICIAYAFGVSTAMEKTNVAAGIAQVFVMISNGIGGQTAALAGVYLVTALMSEVLTNNAAAALMFPIAMKLATQLGIHPNIMSVAVMLGGSAGWILPYSYQCNLMVQAAGKYSTKDFIKVGVPLHPWLFLGVCLILGFGDRWYIAVIASGVFLGLVIIIPLVWECFLPEATKRRINLAVGSFQVKRDRSGTELLRPRSEAE